jgi:isochorismate pyruvate lyase
VSTPDLAPFRAEIDALDREIVALLARRTRVVRELGRLKRDEQTVRSPDRVRQVLERVRALAEAQGMPGQIAVRTYEALIAALTDLQLEELEARRAPGEPK